MHNLDYAHPMTLKNLVGLKPELQDKAIDIINQLYVLGWHPVIWCGLRSVEEERKEIAAGNSSLTNPYDCKHVTGDAVDIVDVRYPWSGPASSLIYKFWVDYGKLVYADPGLRWGGVWDKGGIRWPIIDRAVEENHGGLITWFADVAHMELR